jgi:RimK family alpha-L-glutamate ligase
MRIAIIAAGLGWHVRDLCRAASRLDLEARVLDFRTLSARLPAGGDRGLLASEGLELEDMGRLIVRTLPAGTLEQVVFRMDALHVLEARGVPVLNPPRALEAAIDKYLALARLEAAGLPVPATAACERAAEALAAFEELGGDVVVKPLFGAEGRGLARIERLEEARRRFAEMEAAGAVIYQQRFIDHPGWDLRILTLGREPAGCMRRIAAEGWITNIARGGRPEAAECPARAAELALAAAAAIGAEVAGVDLIPDREGRLWLVEINAVPGWRALQAVSGRDFAVDVLRHALRLEPRPRREASP